MAEPTEKTPQWYVVHTYSGYENKVKDNLEKTVENNGMQDLIFEITVPTEEVAEIRNGKRVTYQRKTFPGYVLVKMIITSESWYVVRNTRGVTGFVGPESKPVALSPEEVELMLNSSPWNPSAASPLAKKSAFFPVPWRTSPARWRKSTRSAPSCA